MYFRCTHQNNISRKEKIEEATTIRPFNHLINLLHTVREKVFKHILFEVYASISKFVLKGS